MKTFIFGVGCGLLLLSVALYFVYTARKPEPIVFTAPTDTEITERARELGMVFLTESARTEKALTDADIIAAAELLGMEFQKPVDLTNPSSEDANTIEGEDPEEPTEEPSDLTEEPNEEPEELTEEPGEEPSEKPAELPERTEEPAEPQRPITTDGQIRVVVPDGLHARTIASLLQSVGIIDDAADFVAYLIANDSTTNLILGTYYFTPGESYDSIVKKMTAI